MNPFELPVREFEIFILIVIRLLVILVALPVIGSRNIPMLVKISLALAVAVTIYPSIETGTLQVPHGLVELTLCLVSEIGIGLFIGFLGQLVFAGVQLAGQFIGYQMGFGIVSVMDPQTSSQLSIIALFQSFFAMLLFLALNVHHLLLQAMVESFQLIPLLHAHYPAALFHQIFQTSGDLFVMAVKIGAPIMAVLLFVNVSMGVIARTVPQMNVFIVAFPFQIGAGLMVLGFSLPMTVKIIQNAFSSLVHDTEVMLRIIGRM